jgi:ribosome biogenesis GTPase A
MSGRRPAGGHRAQARCLAGGRAHQRAKAAEIVITDFRTGTLGRISLESPEEFARWLAEGKQLDAERTARKEAFDVARKAPGRKTRQQRW